MGAHSEAIKLGRALAGAKPLDDDELLRQARTAKDTESEFLNNFVHQLKADDPRYVDEDGHFIEGSMDARATLYVGRLRGTANQHFVESSPPDLGWVWELGGNEHHCEDCPRMASLSPFTRDTLFSYPGDGSTECLGNCTCRLVRSDGISGFGRPASLWGGTGQPSPGGKQPVVSPSTPNNVGQSNRAKSGSRRGTAVGASSVSPSQVLETAMQKVLDDFSLAKISAGSTVDEETLRRSYAVKVWPHLATANPGVAGMDIQTSHVDKAEVDNAEKFLSKVVNSNALPPARTPVRYARGGRAYYSMVNKDINAWDYSKANTFVHEFGHAIEDYSPTIHDKILKFYAFRTAGEQTQFLRNVTGRSYSSSEKTKVDKWISPYIGKLYVDKGDQYATEILSMGLEYMYEDPLLLYEKDKDMFMFIYSLIH